MPGKTANMSEKKVNGYTNGDTNGDADYEIPTWIPQEPVSKQRQPWTPPKDSPLINPGTQQSPVP
jgi:hypothetical protein